MKTYRVDLTKYYSYIIDAENEERAEQLAEDEFASNPYDYKEYGVETMLIEEEE